MAAVDSPEKGLRRSGTVCHNNAMIVNRLALGLVIVLGLGQPACADEAAESGGKCFLWKVTSPTNTVHLLGSVHAMTAEDYPLAAEIETAFDKSKVLVVELDVTRIDKVKMQKLVVERGVYPAGQSLTESLGKETRELLQGYCEKRKLPMQSLDRLRPWLVGVQLIQVEIKAQKMSSELGIDNHFLDAASKAGKEIRELETIESQLGLFSSRTPELQEKSLKVFLSEVDQMGERMEKLRAAWRTGDSAAVEDLGLLTPAKRMPEAAEIQEKTIFERNVAFAEKIDAMLKEKENGFVVIGALHLVGDKGVVKLLEARKYKPEQVSRSAGK